LILIDTLAKIRTPGKRGGNPYLEDYAALEGLKALADRHAVTIVVATHDRKAEADDFFDAVSGTAGLTGVADTILRLERKRGTKEARLQGDGRDIEEPIDLALSFDPVTAWRALGHAEEHIMTETQREVVDALESLERPSTPSEVARALGWKVERVKAILWRLGKEGGPLIVRPNGTYWPKKSPTPHTTPTTTTTNTTDTTDTTEAWLVAGNRGLRS
jgi:hypothetical protein